VSIGALVIFSGYAWAAHYDLDLYDEGYFLDLGQRVLHGQIPYRDFDTYYTPGIFYLFVATFKLFGVSVLPIRLLFAAIRTSCCVLLYLLARRLSAWPFALLPVLVMLGLDPVPIEPEPHPAWPALLATLLMIEALARYTRRQRWTWIALGALAAAGAFAFKQNVGAFALLAIVAYVLLVRRDPDGLGLGIARSAFVAGAVIAIIVFLDKAALPQSSLRASLPVLLSLLCVLIARRPKVSPLPWWSGLPGASLALGIVAGTFALATLAWLVPLTAALGLEATPFALFAGSVNTSALEVPFDPPPAGMAALLLTAIWLPLLVAYAGGVRQAFTGTWPLTVAAGVSLGVVAVAPGSVSSDTPMTLAGWLTEARTSLAGIELYAPVVIAWAGVGLLWSSAGPGGYRERLTAWYVLAGALAWLAVFPRSDPLHALFAGGPLLVVGVVALQRIHTALAGSAAAWRQVAVYVALLLVPVASIAPQLAWRVTLFDPFGADAQPYRQLTLAAAPMALPADTAANIEGVVAFVQAGTPPGEPLFAFPADPLFNVLADRPNPTRFDHYLPYSLTSPQIEEAVAELKARPPRYIVWDHRGVVVWHTDPYNRPLSDYIWSCYREVAAFELVLVLERSGCPG
jgi:hypothetical protein